MIYTVDTFRKAFVRFFQNNFLAKRQGSKALENPLPKHKDIPFTGYVTMVLLTRSQGIIFVMMFQT